MESVKSICKTHYHSKSHLLCHTGSKVSHTGSKHPQLYSQDENYKNKPSAHSGLFHVRAKDSGHSVREYHMISHSASVHGTGQHQKRLYYTRCSLLKEAEKCFIQENLPEPRAFSNPHRPDQES